MAARKTLGFAVGAVAIVVALALFQPWKLWTNSTANEHVMMSSGRAEPMALPSHGMFVSGEHQTTGTVSFVRDSAGSVHLQITNLSTSEGPDVHVVLSEQGPSQDGATSPDYKKAVDLGKLRANHGDLVYDVPAGVDVSTIKTVAVWCKRFDAVFGTAALRP